MDQGGMDSEMPPGPGVEEITGLISYLKSIDWSERWLCGLLAFHATCLMLTLLTTAYHCSNSQIPIFLTFLLLVYCSEYINTWAADHWRSFSSQQYFDSSGLFVSLIFSAPLMFNCMIIVAAWVWSTLKLMIDLKRAKVRHDAREQKQEKKDN